MRHRRGTVLPSVLALSRGLAAGSMGCAARATDVATSTTATGPSCSSRRSGTPPPARPLAGPSRASSPQVATDSCIGAKNGSQYGAYVGITDCAEDAANEWIMDNAWGAIRLASTDSLLLRVAGDAVGSGTSLGAFGDALTGPFTMANWTAGISHAENMGGQTHA